MITEFCTPAELRLCCLKAYGMKINGGGQCSQDKGRAKEKGALLLLLCGCGCEKNISAHAQSVDVTES